MRSGIGSDPTDPFYVSVVSGGGTGGGGSGGASTVANGADVAEGNTNDTAYSDVTGSTAGSIISLLKGQYVMQRVVGNVANGVADAGNPIKIGGLANNAAPTAVTAGQRVNAWYALNGASQTAITDINGGIALTQAPTTDTNATVRGLASHTQNLLSDGTGNWVRARGDTSAAYVAAVPTASAAAGITPVTGAGVTALSVKASAGNLYSASMTAGATAGYFIAYNGATPAAGGTLTAASIINVASVAANGTGNFGGAGSPPDRFGTAITLLFSTSLTTYTAPANAAQFMRGAAA